MGLSKGFLPTPVWDTLVSKCKWKLIRWNTTPSSAPTHCDPFDSCACNEDETFHPLAYSAKDILDNCDASMGIVGNGVCDDIANTVGCGYDRGADSLYPLGI